VDFAKVNINFINHKQLEKLPKITSTEIVERYKQAFSDIDLKENNNGEYVLQISAFSGNLRKNLNFIKNYIEQTSTLA
jgi:hypothetical protein